MEQFWRQDEYDEWKLTLNIGQYRRGVSLVRLLYANDPNKVRYNVAYLIDPNQKFMYISDMDYVEYYEPDSPDTLARAKSHAEYFMLKHLKKESAALEAMVKTIEAIR